ncbi:unnamed protein product [Tetraodon nigroviridis]|uniref:(spotted green pufferfish) hypothetical protein n=1 Tax=Tetraodon nigroviridis TaxID=99883 RepID=Q4TC50_TETNG|nr:unnamed protein product [Tetraodon nigroviridis]
MLSTAVQILAFALALLGVVGSAVATLLPSWKVSSSSWSSPVTPVWQMQGLWLDCVCFASGVFSCTLKPSLLSLPAPLQTTRAAMVLCCVLGLFGLCLASLGLKCTRWGGSRRAKGHTAVAAGACFILASVLCLVPASWFTQQVVSDFRSTDLPESSRFQPGGALCLTFISAGFLLAGGVILCLSCPGRGGSPPASGAAADRHGFPAQPDEQRRPELQPEPRAEEAKSHSQVQRKPDQDDLPPPRLCPKVSYGRQEYV